MCWIHFLFLTIKEMCDLNNSCRNKIIHFKNLWYLQGRFLFIFLYSNWLPSISLGKALWLCHYNCEMRQKGIFSFKAANLFSMYLYFLSNPNLLLQWASFLHESSALIVVLCEVRCVYKPSVYFILIFYSIVRDCIIKRGK